MSVFCYVGYAKNKKSSGTRVSPLGCVSLEGSTLIDIVLASSQICVVGGFYPETSSPDTNNSLCSLC